MHIEGKWYWNPGDIPSDFVHPIELHSDGRAEWLDGSGIVERWQILQGRLFIGSSKQSHSVFQLPESDDDELSGLIRQPFEPYPEDLAALPEAERAGPHYFEDAVALMRNPRDFKIATNSPRVAANDEDQGALL